jgi:signal transduction histidine kinase/CheY-like chemotaxis protein
MSNSILSLQHFLEPVVDIGEDVNCQQLITIFQSGINQVIIVNGAREPLGVIYAYSLLARFLQRQSFNLSRAEINSLIEPLTILPGRMSLVKYYTDFVHHQEQSNYYCFAVVDNNNHLLGILNQHKILKAIALHNLPENNLLTILEKIPLPVMLQTGLGKILAQNDQWRQQISDYLPETIKPDYFSAIKSLPNPTPNYHWEFSKVPLDLDTIPADIDIEKLVWLILANDLKQEPELVTKKVDLVPLTHLKDEFFLAITHDIKSPLTSIICLSSLLKEQKLGKLNPRQYRYVELIHDSGRKIMTLVNELVDLNRLENGELAISLESMQIDAICQQISTDIQEKLTDSQLEFSLEIKTKIKTIKADELRLRQMLSHLLDNAIQFTPPGGKISLTINLWQNWLTFTLLDTGTGISEELQKLIVQKYYPSNQTGIKGLGLILTQRLAQIHGGDISFLSEEDKGSSFTILIPYQGDLTTSNNLVLIIEIIPNYIQQLTELFKNHNYQAIIARSGTEAMEKARHFQPDLICLNPSVSFLSHWDVLTLLKSDNLTKNIPVFLTIQPSEKVENIAKQADAILTLPIAKEKLAASLGKINQKRSLTILYLYPDSALAQISDTQLEWLLHTHTSGLIKRILEADSLEQGELLARFWELDAIVLNGTLLTNRETELESLSKIEVLAKLPLITLDNETTTIANQIPGLQVFPCLIAAKKENLDYLLQVIEIAVGMK